MVDLPKYVVLLRLLTDIDCIGVLYGVTASLWIVLEGKKRRHLMAISCLNCVHTGINLKRQFRREGCDGSKLM